MARTEHQLIRRDLLRVAIGLAEVVVDRPAFCRVVDECTPPARRLYAVLWPPWAKCTCRPKHPLAALQGRLLFTASLYARSRSGHVRIDNKERIRLYVLCRQYAAASHFNAEKTEVVR